MSHAKREYRGGDIQLSAEKPRGLPFLKPLYGPPPYQYTDDVVLIIVYEAEEAAIREVISSLDFLPIILYKEIPSIDGKKCDDAYFLTSTSRLTKLHFKAGNGAMEFPDPGDHPIARLRPLKISSALYGTMDDLYPESIRVLKNLK